MFLLVTGFTAVYRIDHKNRWLLYKDNGCTFYGKTYGFVYSTNALK